MQSELPDFVRLQHPRTLSGGIGAVTHVAGPGGTPRHLAPVVILRRGPIGAKLEIQQGLHRGQDIGVAGIGVIEHHRIRQHGVFPGRIVRPTAPREVGRMVFAVGENHRQPVVPINRTGDGSLEKIRRKPGHMPVGPVLRRHPRKQFAGAIQHYGVGIHNRSGRLPGQPAASGRNQPAY